MRGCFWRTCTSLRGRRVLGTLGRDTQVQIPRTPAPGTALGIAPLPPRARRFTAPRPRTSGPPASTSSGSRRSWLFTTSTGRLTRRRCCGRPRRFTPLWSGTIPHEVAADWTNAFGVFAGLNMVLNKGLAQHLAAAPIHRAPSPPRPPARLTHHLLPLPAANQTTFHLVPAGRLDIAAAHLPAQTVDGGATFAVGGRERWAKALERELGNRYITSVFRNWHATGGSILGLLPRLPDDQLNITSSLNNTGIVGRVGLWCLSGALLLANTPPSSLSSPLPSPPFPSFCESRCSRSSPYWMWMLHDGAENILYR
ncbi:hypothetical protein JB92DRAFT_405619 [Gautieria morchelliformis]|nr:hypothetical protein JB92DRAFT_405619 [Gautieria morchelliformis]